MAAPSIMTTMRPVAGNATLAVFNPAAGGGRAARRLSTVLPELRVACPGIELASTAGPGDATALARAAWQHGTREFVVIGGDGTMFEVLNGLFPVVGDERPAVAYLPLGTGNSVAREFGCPDAKRALATLRTPRRRRVDVLRLEHDSGSLHFVNLFSVGFPAAAGELANSRFKALGSAGYVVAAAGALLGMRPQPMPTRCDAGGWDRRDLALVSFCNSGYTAGIMQIAPGADPGDGLIDVIRVGALSRARFIWTFAKVFRGTHTTSPGVEHTRATTVVFDLPGSVACMIDGEVIRCRPRRLTVLPGALEVLG